MTIKAQGGIAAAIEELEVRLQQLLDEYGKVETALAVLRGLQAPLLPLTPADAPPSLPPPPPAATPEVDTGGGEGELPPKVRAVLKNGPAKRADLIAKGRVTGNDIKRFVKAGLLIATGVTHGRRFALPGTTSAKEAP